MSYILVTIAGSQRQYIKHTPCRFDNKRTIITTKELSEAKTFNTMHEAETLLSKCITNKSFITEPLKTTSSC